VFQELNDQFLICTFVLFAILICLGALLPANWLPPIKNDKLAHFIAFASLTFLAQMIAKSIVDIILWIALIGIAGLLIEIMQKFVPGRNFCWKDLISNFAGIIFSVLIFGMVEFILQ